MDGSPPGSPVCGISQARMLEWVVIPYPGDLPDPGDILNLGISNAGRFFTTELPWYKTYTTL